MKLAVCIPSRGLIHSRTIEGVMRNLEGMENYRLFFSHDNPIPECFIHLTEQALKWGADYVWFVEEDMALRDGILEEMLWHDVSTVDYPVTKEVNAMQINDGVVDKFGTGCTLIKREVLEQTEWRSDIAYSLPKWEPLVLRNDKPRYGHHDVHFAQQLKKLGVKVHVLEKPIDQYRVVEMGQKRVNEGYHKICVISQL